MINQQIQIINMELEITNGSINLFGIMLSEIHSQKINSQTSRTLNTVFNPKEKEILAWLTPREGSLLNVERDIKTNIQTNLIKLKWLLEEQYNFFKEYNFVEIISRRPILIENSDEVISNLSSFKKTLQQEINKLKMIFGEWFLQYSLENKGLKIPLFNQTRDVNGKDIEILNEGGIVLVHITSYFPAKGIIRSRLRSTTSKDAYYGVRDTIHFCINGTVSDIAIFGGWESASIGIIVPFKQVDKRRLRVLNTADTFFIGNFVIPPGSVIVVKNKTFIDYLKRYNLVREDELTFFQYHGVSIIEIEDNISIRDYINKLIIESGRTLNRVWKYNDESSIFREQPNAKTRVILMKELAQKYSADTKQHMETIYHDFEKLGRGIHFYLSYFRNKGNYYIFSISSNSGNKIHIKGIFLLNRFISEGQTDYIEKANRIKSERNTLALMNCFSILLEEQSNLFANIIHQESLLIDFRAQISGLLFIIENCLKFMINFLVYQIEIYKEFLNFYKIEKDNIIELDKSNFYRIIDELNIILSLIAVNRELRKINFESKLLQLFPSQINQIKKYRKNLEIVIDNFYTMVELNLR